MTLKKRLWEFTKSTPIFKWVKRNFYEISPKNFNQPLMNSDETNEYLKELLLNDEPIMISRFGSTELRILQDYYKKRPYSDHNRYTIKMYSGVFPNDDTTLNRFAQLYFDEIPKIDFLGVWFNPFEDVLANTMCPNAKLTTLRNLEPYFSKDPWSQYLEGKKVLVINPFVQSIEAQYRKREKLFEDPRILPDFELITYKSIVSSGGITDFDSWFDALEYMKKDIEKLDFEIAIIGAGAYGLPLAAFIKDMGKKAFHLGGPTQMLFGVYGNRWKNHPDFQNLINEHWTRPADSEKAKNAEISGKTSYW